MEMCKTSRRRWGKEGSRETLWVTVPEQSTPYTRLEISSVWVNKEAGTLTALLSVFSCQLPPGNSGPKMHTDKEGSGDPRAVLLKLKMTIEM